MSVVSEASPLHGKNLLIGNVFKATKEQVCAFVEKRIDWLKSVLRPFHQYFSHIMVTAHIIHVFPGFYKYKPGALKCFAQGHSHKKHPEDPVTPWIMSPVLYH